MQIPGGQLLSFGDGYVEIQNTKEVGGLAAPRQGGGQGLADHPLGHAEPVEGGHTPFIRVVGSGREKC